MAEFLALQDTPVPGILVTAGILFLILGLGGEVIGQIQIPSGRQRASTALGVGFLLTGIILYLIPPIGTSPVAPSPTPVVVSVPSPLSTPEPPPVPTEAPTATPEPPPTAEPTIDRGQPANATATALAQTARRVYGGTSGDLRHEEGKVTEAMAGSTVQNFIVATTFTNPYDAADGPWSYGFFFRRTMPDNSDPAFQEYALYLRSDGSWDLSRHAQSDGQLVWIDLADGVAPTFDASAAGTNQLRLVVNGEIALFFVNDDFIETFDVSAITLPGDVGVATAFEVGHARPETTTRYKDFTVWSLDSESSTAGVKPAEATAIALAQTGRRIYGAVSGELVHEEGYMIWEGAGIAVQDFVAVARFVNPYDAAEWDWSHGFTFRRAAIDTSDPDFKDYIIAVESAGPQWTLRRREQLSDTFNSTITASGPLQNLNLSANGSNRLRLVVSGKIAYFFVNERFIDTLDLSAIVQPGDVGVATSIGGEGALNGAITPYDEFTVWSLDP